MHRPCMAMPASVKLLTLVLKCSTAETQMLGMSFAFYEIQRAGPLPPDSRIPWRADSLKQKGGGNLDGEFQGGYFDAGDHLKFQLPGAYSVARLAWLTWKYKSGLQKTYFDVRGNLACSGVTGECSMLALASTAWARAARKFKSASCSPFKCSMVLSDHCMFTLRSQSVLTC